MRENKFKVWCEFVFEGRIVKRMEGPESWFLLTQAGTIIAYEPLEAPKPLDKAYIKTIPLFYTGKKDVQNKEVCEGDILKYFTGGHEQTRFYVVEDMAEWFQTMYSLGSAYRWDSVGEIVGNKYENPEILKGDKV